MRRRRQSSHPFFNGNLVSRNTLLHLLPLYSVIRLNTMMEDFGGTKANVDMNDGNLRIQIKETT
jgi:hypothetical protein